MAAPSSSPRPAAPAATPRLRLRQVLNLPNLLTLCRLCSIPVFLSFLSRHRYEYALWVFVAAALTDSLDGTVARWFNAKTELGAFLDPFADKLMLISAFVVLTIEGDLPGWLLGVVVIRDVVIVVGYLMLSFFTGERVPVRPSYLGKASTFLQLACVITILGGWGTLDSPYYYMLLYLATAATALSGVHYFYRGLVWLAYREPEMFQ
ncbi:MAG TPA: CDP-alcohol phosphatidyltransferase family protein [Candidatus Binataceae bacterium]|nr:CDP-alcohol phosphatidyltransferase family protein [Candidatus Binataceae bacterium]